MFFQTEMEAVNQDLKGAGYSTEGSVTAVATMLSKTSSQLFLKSIGLNTPTSSKSTSTNETELREQLVAEARAAVQGEVDELKKKSAEAEERMERQEKELDEYKKLVEKNTKEMEENRVLLRGLLKIYAPSSTRSGLL
jgi:flagellar motility protein MotE (MotC chaperone)